MLPTHVFNIFLILTKFWDPKIFHNISTSQYLYLQNLDIRDPAIHELVTNGYLFVLPERDEHGR